LEAENGYFRREAPLWVVGYHIAADLAKQRIGTRIYDENPSLDPSSGIVL
jgi:hypothetical protein